MAECIPLYEAGKPITAIAEVAVTGCRFVAISDPKKGPTIDGGLSSTVEGGNVVVSPAAADSAPFGVAAHDAAADKLVPVFTSGFCVPVTASGAITAGQELECDTLGRVKTYADGNKVGLALDSAADGAQCLVKIY